MLNSTKLLDELKSLEIDCVNRLGFVDACERQQWGDSSKNARCNFRSRKCVAEVAPPCPAVFSQWWLMAPLKEVCMVRDGPNEDLGYLC